MSWLYPLHSVRMLQLIYGSETSKECSAAGRVCRARACKALHNIIHSPVDDKRSRREVKILKYLETVQAHCEFIREVTKARVREVTGNRVSKVAKARIISPL